jgi:hypothetical protein
MRNRDEVVHRYYMITPRLRLWGVAVPLFDPVKLGGNALIL